jgi:hypothetical protein
MARDAELRARITAQDDASKVIEKAAKKADEFDGKTAKAKVTADAKGAIADIDKVDDALNDVDGKTAKLHIDSSALDSLPGKLGDAVGLLEGLGAAGGIGALVGGLAAAGQEAADLAIDAQTTATLTGDTVENASRLQQVWKNSGADVNDLNDVLLQMNGALSPDLAKQLGVNLNDGKAIGERFVEVVDKLGNSTLGASEKAKLMSAVFGEEGVRQVAAMTTQIDGPLKDAIAGVAETTVISPEDVERAQELKAETAKLKTEFQAATQAIGEGMIPLLIQAAQLAAEIGKGLPGGAEQSPFNVFGSKQDRDDMRDTVAAAHGAITAVTDWDSINQGAARRAADQAGMVDSWGLAIENTADAANNAAVAAAAHATAEEHRRTRIEAATEATKRAVAGTEAYSTALGSIDFKNAGLDGALAGMSAFHDQFFGLADIAAANEEAFDNFGQSLKDNGESFDLNTEKGRANQKALEDLSSTMDVQLAAALEDSGGSLETFQGKAKTMADTLRDRLINELGLSAEAADDMIAKLGLLPEDIETRYQLSGDAEAQLKLGFLQTAIDNLPEDVQTTVTQQIIVGDYQGALATVQAYYTRNPAVVKLNVQVGNVEKFRLPSGQVVYDAGGTVGSSGGIAGESGAELVRYPSGRQALLTGGAEYVPPGTRVTSTRQTRAILSRRRLPRYANGTGAINVTANPTVTLPPIMVNLNGRPIAALIGTTTAPAVRAAAMSIRTGRA